MTTNREKLLIYSGSFNPPTKAHLEAITRAMVEFDVHKGCFVPVCREYLHGKMVKNRDRMALSETDRLAMLTAMADAWNAAHPGWELSVDTCEFVSGDSTHTAHTLRDIQTNHPDNEIVYLIGSDKLDQIKKWNNREELLRDVHFVVICRDGDDAETLIENDKLLRTGDFTCCRALENNGDVSSTRVRALFLNGDTAYRDLLVPEVADLLVAKSPADFPEQSFPEWVKDMHSYGGKRGPEKAKTAVCEDNRGRLIPTHAPANLPACTFADAQLPVVNVSFDETVVGCTKTPMPDCIRPLRDRGYNPVMICAVNRTIPCGDYAAGGWAGYNDEEELCRRSTLSQYLYRYAAPKRKAVRDAGVPFLENKYPLSANFGAVYAPGVTFFRGGRHEWYAELATPFNCDVIGAAALNFCHSDRNNDCKANPEDRFSAAGAAQFKSVLTGALRMAVAHGHDCVVLSDLGCKRYHLPAQDVADAVAEVLRSTEFAHAFRAVVISLPEFRKPWEEDGPFAPFYGQFGALASRCKDGLGCAAPSAAQPDKIV